MRNSLPNGGWRTKPPAFIDEDSSGIWWGVKEVHRVVVGRYEESAERTISN
jgi:hypothetical protein